VGSGRGEAMNVDPTKAALYIGRRFKLVDGHAWLVTSIMANGKDGKGDAHLVTLENVATSAETSMPLQDFETVLKSGSCGALDGFGLSDLGNSRRLVYRHGADLRFCDDWKRWLVWDGKRWANDRTGEVKRRAKDTVASIYAEAAQTPPDDRKALGKWAFTSEAGIRRREMIKSAESEPGIPVLPEDLDAHPWLLTIENGTLDLQTGDLLPHQQQDLITKLAPVVYNPDAKCPLWEAFLTRIMGDDMDLIGFLQRGMGYSLTGIINEKALFILYGKGDNGKTTFLEVNRALTGDYALRTPTQTLMAKKHDGVPNDIARLKGARFVSASESEEGRRLSESLIKDLTGGDTMSARFMRAEWFDFVPECKIWLATNHKPEIKGTDEAIWNRIKLVPFEVMIPKEEQDKELIEKLKAELPGILAWAVRGCLDWQRTGLNEPEKVKAATKEYQDEMDELGRFINECCVENNVAQVHKGKLYNAYQKWGGDLSKNKFGRAMTERGFPGRERDTRGDHIWKGIGLLDNEEEQDPYTQAMS